MFENVSNLVAEHVELEKTMSDPSLHADPARARKVGRRYAELTPVVNTYRSWLQLGDDIEAARELAGKVRAAAERERKKSCLETSSQRASGTRADKTGQRSGQRKRGGPQLISAHPGSWFISARQYFSTTRPSILPSSISSKISLISSMGRVVKVGLILPSA
ncbi:PCRF domain-containing protein [Dermabacteraceae bacterium P13101]